MTSVFGAGASFSLDNICESCSAVIRSITSLAERALLPEMYILDGWCLANAMADSAPRPEVPPVMRMVFPFKRLEGCVGVDWVSFSVLAAPLEGVVIEVVIFFLPCEVILDSSAVRLQN